MLTKNTVFFKPLKNLKLEKNILFFKKNLFNSIFSHTNYFLPIIIHTFINQVLKNLPITNLNLFSNRSSLTLNPTFFSKYYYNGLGYKIFRRDRDLFIWIGLTHYTILRIPDSIRIFAKKRRIFLVGTNLIEFKDFLMHIRRIRKIDLYKGKGLLEVKTYKGFIKMKSGKKKQY